MNKAVDRLTFQICLRKLLGVTQSKHSIASTFWKTDFFGFVPKPEITHAVDKCPKHKATSEEIFDLLGYYNAQTQTVHICEHEISSYLEKESKDHKLGLDDSTAYACVREIIRMHEQAHAMIHTCGFNGFSAPSHEWFMQLPREIGEPLAQVIVWKLLNSRDSGNSLLLEVFNKMCKNQPPIYKNWKEISDCIYSSVDEIEKTFPDVITDLEKSEGVELIIPGVLKLARSKAWKDFGKFLGELCRQYPSVPFSFLLFICRKDAENAFSEITGDA